MVNRIECRQKEMVGTYASNRNDVWELHKNGIAVASTTALADGELSVVAQFRYSIDGDALTDAQKLALVNNPNIRLIEKQP